jgi:hypothetical protein
MQTSYPVDPAVARRGARAFLSDHGFATSKIATVSFPAGCFVTRDAADNKCKRPTTSNEVTVSGFGFALFQDSKEPTYPASANDYVAGEQVPVLELGYLYVYCETATTKNGAVFVRFTTATDGTDLGNARNDADTNKAVAFPGASFDQTTSGAGLVRIRLRGSGAAGAQGAQGAQGAAG